MKVGTKSVLFGAHAFWLHPWFVTAAWWKLFGFPFDPRLWVAFFVHDLGYWGKPNMDGAEGEAHPELGARVMHFFFDRPRWRRTVWRNTTTCEVNWRWYDFSRYHSRYLARKDGRSYSRLCVADKLAIALTPAWLYLPMTRLTGEINEYMRDAARAHPDMPLDLSSQRRWFAGVQDYCRRWAYAHQHGGDDNWTTDRETLNKDGVWK